MTTTSTNAGRWKLPGNKTLIGLDGLPTDHRRGWEHSRREYVKSLPASSCLTRERAVARSSGGS